MGASVLPIGTRHQLSRGWSQLAHWCKRHKHDKPLAPSTTAVKDCSVQFGHDLSQLGTYMRTEESPEGDRQHDYLEACEPVAP